MADWRSPLPYVPLRELSPASSTGYLYLRSLLGKVDRTGDEIEPPPTADDAGQPLLAPVTFALTWHLIQATRLPSLPFSSDSDTRLASSS